MKKCRFFAIGLAILFFLPALAKDGARVSLSDRQIKTILIQESLASYSGSCPCPESRDRAGRRCGGRSAYSRPGGASPLCYESDVTNQMVDDYRTRNSTQ